MNIKTLQEKIENAWENRRLLSDEVTMNAIDATIDLLDRGELRVAT
ncbi:MAG: 2,3,4,5-tetrahydropyridine-2,6-dicarboxylate N-succinyltransferase, partial [Capnocytophaga gingivalis]